MKTRLPRLYNGLTLLTLLAAFGLTACNTVRGVGQDIEAAGEAIEDEAKEKKTY